MCQRLMKSIDKIFFRLNYSTYHRTFPFGIRNISICPRLFHDYSFVDEMTSFDTFFFFLSNICRIRSNHINPIGHRSSRKDYNDRFRHYFLCPFSLSLSRSIGFFSIDILRHYLLFIQRLTEEGKKPTL